MERFIRSLRLLWRSERLLAEQQLKVTTGRLGLCGVAALVAGFGLVMLDVAAFFAIQPSWGSAGAALAVGLANFALAGGLAVYARSLQPGTEMDMVKEVRDMAMNDVEEEIKVAESELVELRDEVRRVVRNPVEALLPAVVRPLAGSFIKGLADKGKGAKKK